MRLARTERFEKAWKQLNQKEQVLARKAIINLTSNLSYPALNVKKMKGTKDIWEARASLSLRITFQIEDDVVVLRNIGRHDETLEHP